MNRREMLVRLISLLGLSGTQILVSCQSSQSGGSATGTDLTATSSDSGHTHQFTITAAELASPLSLLRDDSTTQGHSHLVTLSLQDVTTIATGSAVVITSAVISGHSHSYTFQTA